MWHVAQRRDVAVDGPAARQQRRGQDRQRGVLRSGDPDLAREARAAADDDLLQRRPLFRRAGAGGCSVRWRGDAGVLVAQAALGARLPAGFLAADLVAVVITHRATAPVHEVLAAVALRAHRLLALVGAAGRPVGHGRRRLPFGPFGLGRLVALVGGLGRLSAAGLSAALGFLAAALFGVSLLSCAMAAAEDRRSRRRVKPERPTSEPRPGRGWVRGGMIGLRRTRASARRRSSPDARPW